MTWNGFNGSRIITFPPPLLFSVYVIQSLERIVISFLPRSHRQKNPVKSTQRSYRININRPFFLLAPGTHNTCVLHIYKAPRIVVHYECGISFRKASSSSSSFLCSCLRSRVMADHRGHLALPLYFPSRVAHLRSSIFSTEFQSHLRFTISEIFQNEFQIETFFFSRTKEKEGEGRYDAQLSLDKDLSNAFIFHFFFFVYRLSGEDPLRAVSHSTRFLVWNSRLSRCRKRNPSGMLASAQLTGVPPWTLRVYGKDEIKYRQFFPKNPFLLSYWKFFLSLVTSAYSSLVERSVEVSSMVHCSKRRNF